MLQRYKIFLKPVGRNVILIILLGSLSFYGCKRGPKSPSHPHQKPVVSVVTIKPQRVVLTTELPGRTVPYRIAEIRPQVNGLILKRTFREGSNVKAGQILYQIDPAPFQAALDNAEANLAVTRKKAEKARAALSASLANVIRQKATLALALLNRKRFKEALKSGSVSVSQRDLAVTKVKVAEATLKAYEDEVESNRTAIAAAEAAIKQAEAAVKTARINLSYTRITAPISGWIGRSNVTEGAIVTAYQPMPLATIQQLDPIYVDVSQSTGELLLLKRRLRESALSSATNPRKVSLILSDGTPYPVKGMLQFRDVTVDPSTGSVILRMIFPNPNKTLLPGMFVRAVIQEGTKEHAILVPQQGVTHNRKGTPYALVVSADGRVGIRMLTIDRAIGNQWLVTSGLDAGERVIVKGLQYVRPGMPVKIAPPEKNQRRGTGGRPVKKPRTGDA